MMLGDCVAITLADTLALLLIRGLFVEERVEIELREINGEAVALIDIFDDDVADADTVTLVDADDETVEVGNITVDVAQ